MHSSALIARVVQEVAAQGSQAKQVVSTVVEGKMFVSKVNCHFGYENSVTFLHCNFRNL